MKKYLIIIISIALFLMIIFNKENIISQGIQKIYTRRYELFQGETSHYISDDTVSLNRIILKINVETGVVWRYTVQKKDEKLYEKWIIIQ